MIHWQAFVALAVLVVAAVGQETGPSLVVGFPFLNFTFPSAEMYAEYMSSRSYENALLAGVRVSPVNGDIYVSVPRWRAGVPATLARLVNAGNGMTLLQPYPSWAMNSVNVGGALQSVLGFEIDATNTLWALDQGRVAYQAALPGTIKLVAINLNNSHVVLSYVFPPQLASLTNSFLNDLVVDRRAGFVYITDTGLPLNASTGNVLGGLLVFSIGEGVAWRVLNDTVYTNDNPSQRFDLDGVQYNARAGADGIALSSDLQTLYWCPLSSQALYQLPTALLQNRSLASTELLAAVQLTANRTFSSDGLAMSNTSLLLLTSLQDGALVAVSNASAWQPYTVFANETAAIWPDTIGFDHNGSVLLVTNNLPAFFLQVQTFAPNVTNYFIWRIPIGHGIDSYNANVFAPSSPAPAPPGLFSQRNRVYLIIGIIGVATLVIALILLASRLCARTYLPITEQTPLIQ